MRVRFQRNTPAAISPGQGWVSPGAPKYLFGRHADFWALGGASILLWALLLVADGFREMSPPIQQRFAQLSVVFSFLSIFINYPHFMISYRFGYGRGRRFIAKNWFALILVPLGMITVFGLAYSCFSYDVSANPLLLRLDQWLSYLGLDLGVKYRGSLGKELLTGSIWLMYVTVGWHYSKQVFGALMVYARLKAFTFIPFERNVIKWNLFSVAVYQFLYMNRLLTAGGASTDPRFPGILIEGIDLPAWVYGAATISLVALSIGSMLSFANLFFRRGHKPDLTFLVCWASFLIWWIPVKNLPEFYLVGVPFFHSLQYLLFAAKLEESELKRKPIQAPKMIAIVVLTILAGIAGFELVPAMLDTTLVTSINQSEWFFVSIAGVFINVHHFFIDSVVWKLDQAEVRSALFDA